MQQNRVDVFFCIQLDKKTTHGSCDIGPVKCDTGFLKLIMKYYSKFLLSPVVRPFVVSSLIKCLSAVTVLFILHADTILWPARVRVPGYDHRDRSWTGPDRCPSQG